MTEPFDDPLKAIWKSQHTEAKPMSVQAIRSQGEALDRRMRLRTVWGLLVAVAAALLFAWMGATAPNSLVRAGFIIEIAGSVLLAWIAGRRWPARGPSGETSAVELLDHQRAQLVRQQTTFVWILAAAAPMLMGLALVVSGLWVEAARHGVTAKAFLQNSAPLFILLGGWSIAVWVLYRRRSARLRRQIEELDALRG